MWWIPLVAIASACGHGILHHTNKVRGSVRIADDERMRRIRERAYEIWEREGRPEGRASVYWYLAELEIAETESEVGDSRDVAVREAARQYNRDVKEFVGSGQD